MCLLEGPSENLLSDNGAQVTLFNHWNIYFAYGLVIVHPNGVSLVYFKAQCCLHINQYKYIKVKIVLL